ncbi:effector-associated constant component EACC1 [Actinomadura terrae]|uniref:effector-associated constant component EACC1 n=1 Tax=Actinomadura terrae TaxID=604353 RepID=UPI001FA78CCB|nr:hypothetical protein [Actinomadura terrae]
MSPRLEFELRLDGVDDHHYAERLRRELRNTLEDSPDAAVRKIHEVNVGTPPPGRRAATSEIFGLVVESAATLATVVQIVQIWLQRTPRETEAPPPSITLTFGANSLTMTSPPTPAETEIIERFIAVHGNAGGHDGQ